MYHKRNNTKKKIGVPPGTLIYTGEFDNTTTHFRLYVYDEETCIRYEEDDFDTISPHLDTGKKCWLAVIGLGQVAPIQKIGKAFHINPLLLEDILDTAQRPKCEVADSHLFFTLKTLYQEPSDKRNTYQQISILLSEGLLITFQENDSEQLQKLTTRIEHKETLLRQASPDYLFYRIVDTIVDYYYPVLDQLDDKIEDLELTINERMDKEDLQHIQYLKRDLITLRKNVHPLREALSSARKEETFFSQKTIHHLSDVYEHTIHVIESIENYRELSSGLMDLYMTNSSNRMNEIMKVLTIIATIFIPLTFIAGVYGMNFQYMPELGWHWSYPAALLLMLLIALGMILYFKKKKWL